MLKNKLLLILSFSTVCASFGQLSINSPYSRLGIGNLNYESTGFYKNMAGVGTSYANSRFINTANPALLSALNATTFDLGINYKALYAKESSSKSNSNDIAFQNISLAFPIKRRYAFGLELKPYSDISYQINSISNLDSVSYFQDSYTGTGGITKASLINSFSIIKDTVTNSNLALGLNASLISGNIQRSGESLLNTNGTNEYSYTKISNELVYKGFQLNFGMNYRKEIYVGNEFKTIKSTKCDSSQQGLVTQIPTLFYDDQINQRAQKSYLTKYAVIYPNTNGIKISEKIKQGDKRELLMGYYQGFVRDGFGILVLEEALNVNFVDLKNDYLDFVEKFKKSEIQSQNFDNAEKYSREYLHYGSGIFVSFGATYELSSDLNTSGSEKIYRVRTKTDDPFQTFTLSEFSNLNTTLPSTLRLGLSIDKPFVQGANICGEKRKSVWAVGMDLSLQNWSIYQSMDINPNWKNTYRFAIGANITPNPKLEKMKFNSNFRGLLNKMTYQAGIYSQSLPYQYNNKNVSELGFNLGLTIPTNHEGGYLTWSFGAATRGADLKENYLTTGLSLTINETNWFKPYRQGR
jgi:hypothetical protein